MEAAKTDDGMVPVDGESIVGGEELQTWSERPMSASISNGVELATGGPRLRDDCFNDVVALLGGSRMKCTGVLLTTTMVLTARHCGAVDIVVMGTSVESARVMRRVRRTARHPNPRVDAMLLRIDEVPGACVHDRRRSDHKDPPDGTGVILGFGASDRHGRVGAEVLRHADVQLSGWSCSVRSARRNGCSPSHEMVVSGSAADTCFGDSGGALFERAGSTFRLVGITARALPSRGTACGQGGVYTRLDALAPWIAAELGKVEE
ncbi:MAG: trypsin-like serine protease [Candidatus Eisenbacteria bacterium]|nr:trypsin-like serine protease [Candidatus Eisenbacteria bacterium]